ncbi:MAG: FtsX-like permease family protein, partial [Erysipelotrichaceae bacterium]|nr:FtsX-like permease family protein [Erysipelotrichaceae bacterium]
RLPFHFLFGPLGEIGSRNLERAKKRTMLTCAALLVGVSMIVVTTGMTGSFTADLYAWMDAYIGGDVFVGAAVPLTYELKDELESLPGVEHAAPVRYIEIEWIHDEKIEKISFMAVEPTSYTAVTRFVFEDSDLDVDQALDEFKQGGSVFVSSVISEKFKIQTGDTLRIKTLENEQTVKVAGIILDFYNQGLTVTGNWSDMERWFGVNDVTTFFVKATSGVGVTETIRQIKDGYQENYQLIIESNQSIRKRADLLMRQTFSMFDVLGVLAVMVAALGVMNTLSMSVSERTREIGMLRSMGMTRFQVIRMILAEAGLLGIIGGILGLGFGILLTRIFLAAMGAMSGYDLEFVMPVKAMWFSVVVALATSQLAALFPAIRASRTPVLTAI